ncbi:MAG: universal stress protein [Blastocatellales bacterium]
MKKILIAYDGSESAECAISDLASAGLPEDCEAVVLSVSEIVLPPPMSFTLPSPGAVELEHTLQENALKTAEKGCEMLRAIHPGWKLTAEAYPGSPVYSLISKADEWKADLIVLGSHGRSMIGRILLGSVSQSVLTEAHCSVRIGRRCKGHPSPPKGQPVRILIGVDGSEISSRAIQVVAQRQFEPGSEVRLVHVPTTVPPEAEGQLLTAFADWMAQEQMRVQELIESATKLLTEEGITVGSAIVDGDPKRVLPKEAEDWKADVIFLGAKDMTRTSRLRLGSVAAAVASRAECTVEIVR